MAGLTLALAFPLWFRSATYTPGPGSFVAVGVALFVMLGLITMTARGKSGDAETAASRYRWSRDPLFYLGLGFLALLVVQWWNAGRSEIFDAAANRWTYTAPRHPYLPSAITKSESAEMLGWFFPAWALILCVRSGLLGFRAVCLLLLLIVLNAGALVLAGLWHYTPVRVEPGHGRQLMGFATFTYRNHAGAFFSLMLLLALGLLLHELVGRGLRSKRWRRILLTGSAAGLMLVGANLSLSRAGMLSWLAVILAVAYGLGVSWMRMDPSMRLNTVAACVWGVMLCFFAIDGFGNKELAARMKELVNLQPAEELSERGFQARAAVRLWKDNPWFGVGGWGYRYWVDQYVSSEERDRLGVGKANVHNDPLQFLVEFGLVGAALLAAATLLLLIPVLRAGVLTHPLALFPLVGIGITWAHSLIDLPFRSPAILWHWSVILAALPLLIASRTRLWQAGATVGSDTEVGTPPDSQGRHVQGIKVRNSG